MQGGLITWHIEYCANQILTEVSLSLTFMVIISILGPAPDDPIQEAPLTTKPTDRHCRLLIDTYTLWCSRLFLQASYDVAEDRRTCEKILYRKEERC